MELDIKERNVGWGVLNYSVWFFNKLNIGFYNLMIAMRMVVFFCFFILVYILYVVIWDRKKERLKNVMCDRYLFK